MAMMSTMSLFYQDEEDTDGDDNDDNDDDDDDDGDDNNNDYDDDDDDDGRKCKIHLEEGKQGSFIGRLLANAWPCTANDHTLPCEQI